MHRKLGERIATAYRFLPGKPSKSLDVKIGRNRYSFERFAAIRAVQGLKLCPDV